MRVGLTESRDQRGEWKTQLEESVSLQLKERNADLDDKILRGEVMESAIRTQVEHRKRPVISFLESSTFTDTEWERNLVIADCVLYLQEFARKYGLEFRLVEMRWGIRADASSSHQTSDICNALKLGFRGPNKPRRGLVSGNQLGLLIFEEINKQLSDSSIN